MTALTANLALSTKEGVEIAVPVLASEIIYEGAPVLISESGGYAFSPDGSTNVIAIGDMYAGICLEKVDNSSGSSGDKKVRVLIQGLVRMPVAGTLTQAKLGDPVYVNDTSDDSTLTLTPDPTHLQFRVGTFVEHDTSSNGWIAVTGHTLKKVSYDQEITIPSQEGIKSLKVLKFSYSFATDGGATGIVIGTIPSGTVILGGVINITTTLTSGGMATIAIDSQGSADLKSATAVASWTAGFLALNSNTTLAASCVKTTAQKNITMTIATADLTAGAFDLYLLVANV